MHVFWEVGSQRMVMPMGHQSQNQIRRPMQQSLNSCFAIRLKSTRDAQLYYHQHSIFNIEWQGNITNPGGLVTKLG